MPHEGSDNTAAVIGALPVRQGVVWDMAVAIGAVNVVIVCLNRGSLVEAVEMANALCLAYQPQREERI